jgi:hypothetical protein
MNDRYQSAADHQGSTAAGQRKQSSSGLTIVFSKLVTLAGNRGCLLRMVFEDCNPLIYCAAMTTS